MLRYLGNIRFPTYSLPMILLKTFKLFSGQLLICCFHINLNAVIDSSMHSRMGFRFDILIVELLTFVLIMFPSGLLLELSSRKIVLTLMLFTTSLKSIIPNPRFSILLCNIVLFILSGALFLSMSLFHRNLYIKLVNLDSSAFVNFTVAQMKSICDKPYVLYITILPRSVRPLQDHSLNCFSMDVYIFSKFRFFAVCRSNPRLSPFILIIGLVLIVDIFFK